MKSMILGKPELKKERDDDLTKLVLKLAMHSLLHSSLCSCLIMSSRCDDGSNYAIG